VRQQQAGQIGTGDHNQADHGCAEQPRKPRGTWLSLGMNAFQRRERQSRGVSALRMSGFQLTRQAAHFGLSLIERPTRFQPSD
jgi:hypothetical protein